MEQTPNKNQHRKLTPERKILLPLMSGLELATFRSRGRHSANKHNKLTRLPYISTQHRSGNLHQNTTSRKSTSTHHENLHENTTSSTPILTQHLKNKPTIKKHINALHSGNLHQNQATVPQHIPQYFRHSPLSCSSIPRETSMEEV